MLLNDIKHLIYILYELNYVQNDRRISHLILHVRRFNPTFDEEEVKEAVFLIAKKILEDGSHRSFKLLNTGKEYGKENYVEFLSLLERRWPHILVEIEVQTEKHVMEEDGETVHIDPYLFWTPQWFIELKKLNEMGFLDNFPYK